MTPAAGRPDGAPSAADAVARAEKKIGRLLRRADFLRVAKGRRWHGKALTLQAATSLDDKAAPRVGFTLTRKVGGAVVRNRARRRLKEALRVTPDLPVRGGHDYVVIGRIEAVRLPFAALQDELARAFIGVHQAGRRKQKPGPPAPATTRADAAAIQSFDRP